MPYCLYSFPSSEGTILKYALTWLVSLFFVIFFTFINLTYLILFWNFVYFSLINSFSLSILLSFLSKYFCIKSLPFRIYSSPLFSSANPSSLFFFSSQISSTFCKNYSFVFFSFFIPLRSICSWSFTYGVVS